MHVVVVCQELGVDESRLVVSYDQAYTQLATVSVLPREQTMTSDVSIDEVINRAVLFSTNRFIWFEFIIAK